MVNRESDKKIVASDGLGHAEQDLLRDRLKAALIRAADFKHIRRNRFIAYHGSGNPNLTFEQRHPSGNPRPVYLAKKASEALIYAQAGAPTPTLYMVRIKPGTTLSRMLEIALKERKHADGFILTRGHDGPVYSIRNLDRIEIIRAEPVTDELSKEKGGGFIKLKRR